MKKALNTALDFSCEQELIDMVTHFVKQKKFELENINNEDTHFGQPEEVVIINPLVIKHYRQPATKHLKSSSEMQSHKEPAHNHSAINFQDPNLRVPLSIVNLNSNSNNSVDNNTEDYKRKYVCNTCSETGHNAHTCKQQE
ncbi:5312_t:CDS:1 [Cetraspora pellucida]|uniref:5312_t:CDS:1 n=1 Tax=Cetraspora pellucida TaxID=1433469 RepID=A0A9N9NCL5_9GLOM|nr:5312_t:CDS:1 [Cetraspora pellucida]